MKRWSIGIAAVVVMVIVALPPVGFPPASDTAPTPQQPAPSAPSPASIGSIGSPASPVLAPSESPAPASPPAESPRPVVPRPDPPDPEAKVALDALALQLRNYGHRFGGNPVGSNAEITATLNGKNEATAKYLPQEHTNISPQGELLDHWGTPYFFHQQSAFETTIRSAGPDKKLYTVDDITAK